MLWSTTKLVRGEEVNKVFVGQSFSKEVFEHLGDAFDEGDRAISLGDTVIRFPRLRDNGNRFDLPIRGNVGKGVGSAEECHNRFGVGMP